MSDTLPQSVLLGVDVPELEDLMADSRKEYHDKAFAVTTRSRAKREQQEEEEHGKKQEESGVRPKSFMEAVEEDREQQEDSGAELVREFNFTDDLFAEGRIKEHMTRAQKRKSQQEHFRADEVETLPSGKKLKELQEKEEDIQKLVLGASTRDQLVKRDGLIFRHRGILINR